MTPQPISFDRPIDCFIKPDAAALPIHACRPDSIEAIFAKLPHQAGFLQASGFIGTAGQAILIPGTTPASPLAGVALGLGSERSPWSHAGLPMLLPETSVWRLEPGDYDEPAAVLGWALGAYRYRALTAPGRRPATLAVDDRTFPHALALARAAWLARDLINTPANLLGPAELAQVTVALATRFGAASARVEGSALATAYPTIAAVGAGSDRAPVVAAATWSGTTAGFDAPLVYLCGKGVVFDSGGYDLKPSGAMLRMKKDMGGAALMLALASAIMASDLPVRLELRIGCVENMVSGRAMRPLDVLTTRRGLTVEVGNTDAEGRLVLCDLLAEASDARPDLVIDAATLTGAARVALGPDLPALFCNDDLLAERALAAGVAAHDLFWRLPLHPGYDAWLASPVADLSNVASKPMAGAIVAALFLQRFIAPDTPWLHVDTYAWNDATRPGRPEGGEALGLYGLFGLIQTLKRGNRAGNT